MKQFAVFVNNEQAATVTLKSGGEIGVLTEPGYHDWTFERLVAEGDWIEQ